VHQNYLRRGFKYIALRRQENREFSQTVKRTKTLILTHMVFDVKVDFTRKARYVGGGHVTKPPSTQTYASVVSRESVRIAFLYAALNDLNIMSADIQGAYLNSPCKERVYTRCGPEFGPDNVGRVAHIVKALYGLRTSAFASSETTLCTEAYSLSEKHSTMLFVTPKYCRVST
jgi:Reverse transcriptase (RNA-dependent DNA polymerase)